MPSHTPALLRTTVVAVTAAAAAFFSLAPAATPAAPAAPTAAAAPVEVAQRTVALAAPSNAVAAAALNASPAAKRAAALETALAQLGKPYRYGATGPSSFDCSGLTSFAFKNAGVSIPRTSRAQSTVGTPVSKSDLQPGDLVFFYKPVSHVAIYIGNGQVVHASTSGQPVKISNVDNMPFSGARRV
ncbi:C40 family peptidase [Pseudonocardia oroxyli]|uniref:Cell wall-associated hydrolase, NlpC family n=1 Tax=Pseudonocardia oroxyli TaxID=366584 RepID=A0A1G7LN38_PSEOR|nr:Cell wall-associated hydrolase, NlpC family [Pseudonocardia oroxyli]